MDLEQKVAALTDKLYSSAGLDEERRAQLETNILTQAMTDPSVEQKLDVMLKYVGQQGAFRFDITSDQETHIKPSSPTPVYSLNITSADLARDGFSVLDESMDFVAKQEARSAEWVMGIDKYDDPLAGRAPDESIQARYADYANSVGFLSGYNSLSDTPVDIPRIPEAVEGYIAEAYGMDVAAFKEQVGSAWFESGQAPAQPVETAPEGGGFKPLMDNLNKIFSP